MPRESHPGMAAAGLGHTVATKATAVAALERPGYTPDRPGKPMQDRTFVATIGSEASPLLCCGVLDGHGRKGHDVASFFQRRLPEELSKCCSEISSSDHRRLSNAMAEAFLGAQQAIIEDTSVASRASGTTAVVAILDEQRGRVTVGNVGDSRAVYGARANSGIGSSSWFATALSADTTTKNMPAELERVLAKGARVDSQGNVFAGPIGISMTRALGDTVLKSVGVLAEPHFAASAGARLPPDRPAFLLLASDGVWGVLTDERAVAIVGAVLDDAAGAARGEAAARRALEALAAAAAEKWQDGLPCEVLIDDISCVLVVLDG